MGPRDLRRPVEGRGPACTAEQTERHGPAPQPLEQHELMPSATWTIETCRSLIMTENDFVNTSLFLLMIDGKYNNFTRLLKEIY